MTLDEMVDELGMFNTELSVLDYDGMDEEVWFGAGARVPEELLGCHVEAAWPMHDDAHDDPYMAVEVTGLGDAS